MKGGETPLDPQSPKNARRGNGAITVPLPRLALLFVLSLLPCQSYGSALRTCTAIFQVHKTIDGHWAFSNR
jgi:hypothetical protein